VSSRLQPLGIQRTLGQTPNCLGAGYIFRLRLYPRINGAQQWGLKPHHALHTLASWWWSSFSLHGHKNGAST
jgi:hypothetical protein